jgi:hypothetical protein
MSFLSWKPSWQATVPGISFQFLPCHPFECFGQRRIFKLDGLPRSTFRAIGDLSGCLHVTPYRIPHLSLGYQLGPRTPFLVVGDCVF